MSLLVLDLVFRAKITGRIKHALIGVANYADDEGYCFPKISTVAADVGCTRFTIKRAFKEAVQNGLLSRSERKRPDGSRTTDGYQINLDALRAVARPDEKAGDQQIAAKGGQQIATEGGQQIDTHPPQQNDADGPQQIGGDIEPSLEPPDYPSGEPSLNHRAIALTTTFDQEFEKAFWPLYPNKVGKPKTEISFVKARKAGTAFNVIMDGLERYARKDDYRQWCNPATWLNQERWNDEPATAPKSENPTMKGLRNQYNRLFGEGGKHGGHGNVVGRGSIVEALDAIPSGIELAPPP
jgi:hypothetical protein